MRTPLFLLLLASGWGVLLNAQSLQTEASAPSFAIEAVLDNETDAPDPVRQVTRTHRRLLASYSGFLIELTVAELPLRRDHHVFQKFGDVRYVKRPDGRYAYLIPVDFRRRQTVEEYLHNIVMYKAPGARVVEYRRGVEILPRALRKPRRRFRFD